MYLIKRSWLICYHCHFQSHEHASFVGVLQPTNVRAVMESLTLVGKIVTARFALLLDLEQNLQHFARPVLTRSINAKTGKVICKPLCQSNTVSLHLSIFPTPSTLPPQTILLGITLASPRLEIGETQVLIEILLL